MPISSGACGWPNSYFSRQQGPREPAAVQVAVVNRQPAPKPPVVRIPAAPPPPPLEEKVFTAVKVEPPPPPPPPPTPRRVVWTAPEIKPLWNVTPYTFGPPLLSARGLPILLLTLLALAGLIYGLFALGTALSGLFQRFLGWFNSPGARSNDLVWIEIGGFQPCKNDLSDNSTWPPFFCASTTWRYEQILLPKSTAVTVFRHFNSGVTSWLMWTVVCGATIDAILFLMQL